MKNNKIMSLYYIIKNAFKIDFINMKNNINKIHNIAGKSKAVILLDMINCAFKYGAGHVDYTIFGMYNLNGKQRSTLLTRKKNNDYVSYLNPKSHQHFFDNKTEFLKKFEGYIGREYLNLKSADEKKFNDFCSRHPVFIAKPENGQCGQGIEKIDSRSWESTDQLYLYLNKTQRFLLEQVIVQHEKVSELFKSSVNTIRIVTIVDDHQAVHTVFACMRVGRGTNVVDNFNSGGMSIVIDTKKGQLTGLAVNKNGETFTSHPDTNVKFDGFAIPFWQRCLNLVVDAAALSLPIRYIGWDVAITPEGPVLVEGNQFPGHDLFQLVAQNPDKKGMLSVYDKIVPYDKLKKEKS